MQTQPITDQIANISPFWVVVIVAFFTFIRILFVRSQNSWGRVIAETCDTINFVLILAFLLVRPFVAQAFYIPSASMRETLIEGDRLIVNKFSYRLYEPQRKDIIVFNAPAEATIEGIEGIDFIKRLIAVPGDEIEIRAATMRFDGEVFEPAEWGVSAHDYLRNRLNLGREPIRFFPDHILVDQTRRITTDELARALGRRSVTLIPGQTIVNGRVLDEPYIREDADYNMPPTRLPDGQFLVLGDNRNESQDSHIWGLLDDNRVVGRAVVIFWPPNRVRMIR